MEKLTINTVRANAVLLIINPRESIEHGLGSESDAAISKIKTLPNMAVAAFKFANVGTTIKTFSPTWDDVLPIIPLIVLITMAIMNHPIVDGPQPVNKIKIDAR
jgi:hypothetical protein